MGIWIPLKRKNTAESQSIAGERKVRVLRASSCTSRSSPLGHSTPHAVASLRRRGSRLLTVLKISKGIDPPAHYQHLPSCPTCQQQQHHHLKRSTSLGTQIMRKLSALDSKAFADRTPPKSQFFDGPAGPANCERDETDAEKTISAPETSYRKHREELRRIRSLPVLSRRLSRRFTAVFNHNPTTVVHRPSRASRPTVLPLKIGLDLVSPRLLSLKATETASTAASTNAASFTKSSVHDNHASSQLSTAPTSFVNSSNESIINGLQVANGVSFSVPTAGLTTIPEFSPRFVEFPSPKNLPSGPISIYTVETASAAKIYLETHFNEILASQASPRSLRRRNLEDYLRQFPCSLEERREAWWTWNHAESENLRLTRVLKTRSLGETNGLAIGDYELVRVLGKGSFGVVRLVRKNTFPTTNSMRVKNHRNPNNSDTGELIDLAQLKNQIFAMKVIRKSDMLRNSQEGHLRAERDFLVASAHAQWVVPLIESFQDQNHLYLVMEYMVGGDFLGLLCRWDVLPEPMARFYVAEMILCVEEAHKMKWIHRDIKPDNFLVSASGHLKISDFGLAFDGHWSHSQNYYNDTRTSLLERLGVHVNGDERDIEEQVETERSHSNTNDHDAHPQAQIGSKTMSSTRPEGEFVLDKLNAIAKRKMAKSIVGTSQYMAPEVVQGDYYDGRCDWWSLGIILYECLFGSTPFYGDTREETKKRIVMHRRPLVFPNETRKFRSSYGEVLLLPAVSTSAMDLVNALLAPKNQRLSSRKYRENDLRGRRGSQRGSRYFSIAANYVFADDAEDIKLHPFFENVDWTTIHLSHPPFVPRVSLDQPITKYFEDERNIIETSGAHTPSSLSHGDCALYHHQHTASHELEREATRLFCDTRNNEASPDDELELQRLVESKPSLLRKLHTRKEKKRARDKILRDPKTSKTAMQVRKQSAFLGYTYRRPEYELVGEALVLSRRSILPSAGLGIGPVIGA